MNSENHPSTNNNTKRRQIFIAAAVFAILLLFAAVSQPTVSYTSTCQTSIIVKTGNGTSTRHRGIISSSKKKSSDASSSSNSGSDSGSADDDNDEPETPQKISAPPKSSSSNPFKYKPQIRYEPSLFEHDPEFMLNASFTPLRLINKSAASKPPLPEDWDGGYGWVFVKYHPSPFEREWAKQSIPIEKTNRTEAPTPLCDLLKKKFSNQLKGYVKELPRMTPDDPGNKTCEDRTKLAEQPMKFDSKIFSRFEYEYKCTRPPCRSSKPPGTPRIGAKKYSYIEPLVGILRHPLLCQDTQKYLKSKNWLLVDPWPLQQAGRSTISPKPKVAFFDLGTSTFTQSAAGDGGASQSWFHRVYESMCLPFSDWFMWEATMHDPRKVWKQIPGRLKPHYFWYNIPITPNMDSFDNPLNILLTKTRKEDVVIFKIDYDSLLIEKALIDQILQYPEVAELVDEFFFEFHLNAELMSGVWRTTNLEVYQSAALEMFTELRKRGIRAHSWV